MATNYIQPGNVVTVTAPSGGVASGDGVLIGTMFGVATHAADEGDDLELALTGVWELPKTNAQAWTAGAAIYWDNSGKKVTTTSGGNTKVGVAVKVAANPSTEGVVRLNGSF